MVVVGFDGKKRCFGGSTKEEEFYALYHDHEWCIPHSDDSYLFELLILESFQAGLSWRTILKKREAYRASFHNFDPKKIIKMKDSELEDLIQHGEIVRNRLKIYSTRKNAEIFLSIIKEFGSFNSYLKQFIEKSPKKNRPKTLSDLPTLSEESISLSKDLKKRGMSFVGPVTMYSYLQAIGMIDDHLAECWKA